MVTSSAVVGSSATSSFGSLASAMAIITRCCMPPDISKRIILEPRFRRGNADEFQQADDFGVGGRRPARCSLSDSLICAPTRKTGFNDAPGS